MTPDPGTEDLVDSIESTICSQLIAKMPPDSSGDLASMPLRQLLAVYWTWRERFPLPRPRRVHHSRELDADPAAQRYASEHAELERKIMAGEDLTPHLSDRVETAYISEQQRQSIPRRRRDADRDRLLAAWGVHHLHLSNVEGKGRFNQRGGDLLFAIFQSDDAYLLGVYPHDDWERVGLVEVIVRNWPNAGLFLKSNFARGQTARFTDEDRRVLRRANINEAVIEGDGSFYGPPGLGLTAAGGSVSADRRAMAYMENLRQLRESLDDRLNVFGRELDEAAGHQVTGAWEPHVHDGQIGSAPRR